MTVIREWSARADAAGRETYLDHFESRVAPHLRATEGFQGAEVLERDLDGQIELTVRTRWPSLEAIRAFAGEDITRAVVEENAARILLDYDRQVTHRHVVGGCG